jgi:hypothetical protein
MEMRQITASVKKDLLRAGFDNNNLSVQRGKGTAAFWIHVSLDISRAPGCSCGEPDQYGRRETCQCCKDKWSHIHSVVENIALKSSGRDDRRDDLQCILIQLGFKN